MTIGPPAAAFYLRNRARLFLEIPLVADSLDERLVPRNQMRAGDSAIADRVDLPMLIDSILTFLPDTRNFTVVPGASELERFWQAQVKRELASYMDRTHFGWTNDLSLAQIKARVANAPIFGPFKAGLGHGVVGGPYGQCLLQTRFSLTAASTYWISALAGP